MLGRAHFRVIALHALDRRPTTELDLVVSEVGASALTIAQSRENGAFLGVAIWARHRVEIVMQISALIQQTEVKNIFLVKSGHVEASRT